MRITWNIFLENLAGWCRASPPEMAAIAVEKKRGTYLRRAINYGCLVQKREKSRGFVLIDLVDRNRYLKRKVSSLFSFFLHFSTFVSIIDTNNFKNHCHLSWISKILKF